MCGGKSEKRSGELCVMGIEWENEERWGWIVAIVGVLWISSHHHTDMAIMMKETKPNSTQPSKDCYCSSQSHFSNQISYIIYHIATPTYLHMSLPTQIIPSYYIFHSNHQILQPIYMCASPIIFLYLHFFMLILRLWIMIS